MSHYKTLGVSSKATHADIRRAYHDEARRWHPDRFINAPAAESRQAETAMRSVNEAWRVLGDDARRAAYDRQRAERNGTAGPSVGDYVRTDDGVPRVDPRLFDPEFLASRRRLQEEEREVRHSGTVRVLGTVGFFGMLLAIFIFTAYANGSRATAPTTTTVPGPDIGVEAGSCVLVMSEGQLLPVPCDGLSDGRVIGAREPEGSCPAGTFREALLSNGLVACLGN